MEMENPYAPPEALTSEGTLAAQQGRPPLAGTGKRFLTYLIDWVVRFFLTLVAAAVIVAATAAKDEPDSEDFGSPDAIETAPDEFDVQAARLERNPFFEYGLGYVVALCYYALLEAASGRTLGKLATGTKVLAENYETAPFLKILGRSLLRWIPFEPFSAFSGSGKMWHDSGSGTITVDLRARPLPPRRPYVPGQRPLIVRHPAAQPKPPGTR